LVLLSPLFAAAQNNYSFSVADVWKLFNTNTHGIGELMQAKGFVLNTKAPQKWSYINVVTSLTATVSFTITDSSRISGINIEQKRELAPAAVKDLTDNGFVFKEPKEKNVAIKYDLQNIIEFESAKYMLFCSVLTSYPKKGVCSFNYAWHDLITQSLVVVKRGNNPYLTDGILAMYEQTSLDTFKIDKNNRYKLVSENATFKGGRRGMYIFLNDNVLYPEAALKDTVEGFVTVQFTVDAKGKAIDAKVIKGKELGHGLPEEAIRLVSKMPLWKPALEVNRIVSSTITQTILFKIELNNLL
jgi:protein TonB